MVQLSREIRFALVPPDTELGDAPANSWAGWPSTNLVVPHLVLRCVVEGEPDAVTGFLCNIKVIDRMLRMVVTEKLIPVYNGCQTAEQIILLVAGELSSQWQSDARLVSVHLGLSPFLSYSIGLDQNMSSPSNVVHLTGQFEFSAAHRLQCDTLSETENQSLFGKCNNPEGHGHNYVVEVTVSGAVDAGENQMTALGNFEATVKRLIIDPLDHKHLNRDVEYFSNVNPTVENIAVAIHGWLDGEFDGVELEKIRVYETPKTWAEYSGS